MASPRRPQAQRSTTPLRERRTNQWTEHSARFYPPTPESSPWPIADALALAGAVLLTAALLALGLVGNPPR